MAGADALVEVATAPVVPNATFRPAVTLTGPVLLLTVPLMATSLVAVLLASSVTEPEPLAALTLPLLAATVRVPLVAVKVIVPLPAVVETPLTVEVKQVLLATWPVLKPTESVKLMAAGAVAAKVLATSLPALVNVMLPPALTPSVPAVMAADWETVLVDCKRTVLAVPTLMAWLMVSGPLHSVASWLVVLIPLVPRTLPTIRAVLPLLKTMALLVAAARVLTALLSASRKVPVPWRRRLFAAIVEAVGVAVSVTPAAFRSTVAPVAVMPSPAPLPMVNRPPVVRVTLLVLLLMPAVP